MAAGLRGEMYPLDGEVYAAVVRALLHLERRGTISADHVARALAGALPWQLAALGPHLLHALGRHPAPSVAAAACEALVMAGRH